MMTTESNGLDQKPYFDAIIVVPLEEEFEVVIQHFTIVDDLSNDVTIKFSAGLSGSNACFLLVKQAAMGKAANHEAFSDCLHQYDTGLLVCLGIAGCLSGDVAIGDVCYSGTIIDVLENAKIVDDVDGVQGMALSSRAYNSPREVTIPIARDRISPATKPHHDAWTQASLLRAKTLIPGEFKGREGRLEKIAAPTVREGVIVCGFVSASPTYNNKLKEIERKVLAIETESGGMAAVAEQRGIAAIAVRGISDYAGIDKNLFEKQTNNNARLVAVSNATTFLVRQLSSPMMSVQFKRMRTKRSSNSRQLDLLPTTSLDNVGSLLLKLSDDCNEKLRDLAPGFALQARGYRLPIPRIRMQGRAEKIGDPVEIREAIRDTRILMLHVPREYPDYSLAWIISNDLITMHIDGRQVIPSVIEARSLQRPRRGISDVAGRDAVELEKSDEVIVIFIIDDVTFGSKSKTEFLRSQIEEHPSAKYIILTRDRTGIESVDDFTITTASSTAKLCEISFSEISHFVQKNFEMAPSASEVVALRLRETFSKYHLSAHPSYFAGIPKDILHALLQANRRAELIELAVAGYLSYLVADDLEPVSLSRKTRQAFLEEIAFEIRVGKKSFSESELIVFVVDFAKRFDFRITPLRFISAFMEKGILHSESGCIRFTLPFMESYLLASRLRELPDEHALSYFTIEKNGFDYRTFSLYAEMGPSSKIVAKIVEEMDKCIIGLKNAAPPTSVLLDNTVVPKLLQRQDRLASIQSKIQKAEDDVRNDRDQSREKQRLLDASDRVRETASARLIETQRKNDSASADGAERSLQERATSIWLVALSLLGSGAERLEADVKRTLVSKVITISVRIIDGLTRSTRMLDIDKVQADINSEPEFIKSIAKSGSEEHVKEANLLIVAMLEYFEFLLAIHPFIQTVGAICEEARDNVLAESIANVSVEDDAEDLIKYLWLSDINVPRGKSDLLRLVRKLPRTKFVRHLVAAHMMTRVYWKQWKKKDRIDLLNVAKESLKGIGLEYKVSEIERLFERKATEK